MDVVTEDLIPLDSTFELYVYKKDDYIHMLVKDLNDNIYKPILFSDLSVRCGPMNNMRIWKDDVVEVDYETGSYDFVKVKLPTDEDLSVYIHNVNIINNNVLVKVIEQYTKL